MPFAAAIGSVYPATYMRGNRETYHPMETNWPRCAALRLTMKGISSADKQEQVGDLPKLSEKCLPSIESPWINTHHSLVFVHTSVNK